MKLNMMWIVYAVMIVITFNSALAATFTDSFDVVGLSDYNTSGAIFEDINIGAMYGSDSDWASINFSERGFIFNNSINMSVSVGAAPNSNTLFNCIGFNSGLGWLNGDYVLVCPNVDSIDSFNNDDLQVSCGGACSCTTNTTLVSPEAYNYSVDIDIDTITGNIIVMRNDSQQVTTTYSGCDISQFNTLLFMRYSPDNYFYDFSITDNNPDICTPNWTCSAYAACLPNNTQLCNVAVDNNSCGEMYSGDYSEFTPQSCVYGNITGYQGQYSTGDYVNIMADGLGTAGAVFVSFIALIVIVGLAVWGYSKIKRGTK
jgi:hypothetical protein